MVDIESKKDKIKKERHLSDHSWDACLICSNPLYHVSSAKSHLETMKTNNTPIAVKKTTGEVGLLDSLQQSSLFHLSASMAPGATLSVKLRPVLSCLGSNRLLSTSAAHHAPPSQGSQTFTKWVRPAHTPVYVVLGMVLMALGIGLQTAKHQIMHSPEVKVSKKKRQSVMEVDDPDQAVSTVGKYIDNSFFRKVAHVQEHHHHDPSRPDPFLKPREAETLKSVGVDPKTSALGNPN